MQHHARITTLTLGSAVIAVWALTACGGSGSSTSSRTTVAVSNATAGAPVTSAAPTATAAPAATSGAPVVQASSPGSLPSDACTLLTDQEASQLAGASVTGHPLSPGPKSRLCQYRGAHDVDVTVTAYADAAAAHAYVQLLLTSLHNLPTKVPNVGDETYEYAAGNSGGFGGRRGAIVVLVVTTGSAPSSAALAATAKTVVGRL